MKSKSDSAPQPPPKQRVILVHHPGMEGRRGWRERKYDLGRGGEVEEEFELLEEMKLIHLFKITNKNQPSQLKNRIVVNQVMNGWI